MSMPKYFIYFFLPIIFFFKIGNAYSETLKFKGISKLSIEDIQTLTSIDINKKKFSRSEIDQILKELYNSDLIYKIEYDLVEDIHLFEIKENSIIENIYINGNINVKDELIISNIKSNSNSFLNKDKIKKDLDIISSIYNSAGYDFISVEVRTERVTDDKINLIFIINEGTITKLNDINFLGNETFSDRYLYSQLTLKEYKNYNIFTAGSNINPSLFITDRKKLLNFYRERGFFDVKVDYEIYSSSLGNYIVEFYISEGTRYKIDLIQYEYIDEINSIDYSKITKKFNKQLLKNSSFYNLVLIEDHIIDLTEKLRSLNYLNRAFSYHFFENSEKENILKIIESKVSPTVVNKISINGNTITKDKTLRSKINIEPGDYLDSSDLVKSKKDLSNLRYINKVEINEINRQENSIDLIFEIDENKKTGNFLFGGSFSGDTGFGLGLGLKDYNLLGTGNELNFSIDLNSEKSLFNLNYTTFNLLNSRINYTYSIFNEEKDLSSSFGFKTRNRGVGYKINNNINDNLSISLGIEYENIEGYSQKNQNNYITDNIATFDQTSLIFSLMNNNTNDLLYPTNGYENSIRIRYNPEFLSDDSYYKLNLNNKFYYKLKKSENFLFNSNSLGIAESLNGNLKTINAFSLGGLNFKGFDYRGIGPTQDNIYLGGNKFFTTTFGYGSSFIFDKKDNINIKLFSTFGSIWDSDYANNNEFNIRASYGASFDILTAVGPISLSYAIPFDKQINDKSREFNFSIGTSF